MSSRPSALAYRFAAVACLAALAFAVGPPAAAAPVRLSELASSEAYTHCIQLARKDPQSGFEAAITWRDEGGGAAAHHCTAMALVNLGQYADAASRLETLAGDMKGFDARERAAVLGQSGRVWLRAGRAERALAALSAAIGLAPADAELHIDRGEVRAAAGQLWEAIDDFNAALDLAPDNVDALIFRGAAYRLLEAYDLARDDLAAALTRDPDNPDALTELGAVEVEAGNRGAARQRWLRTIEVAPASPAADVARRWLERIDVKTD